MCGGLICFLMKYSFSLMQTSLSKFNSKVGLSLSPSLSRIYIIKEITLNAFTFPGEFMPSPQSGGYLGVTNYGTFLSLLYLCKKAADALTFEMLVLNFQGQKESILFLCRHFLLSFFFLIGVPFFLH